MYSWTISKYDPKKRNEQGRFMVDEWTEMGDIGKSFDGVLLTKEEYVRIEDLYLNAINLFLDELKVEELQVTDLENYMRFDEFSSEYCRCPDLYTEDLIFLFNNVQDGQWLNKTQSLNMCRLNLRGGIWCRLSHIPLLALRFGFDSYMTISSYINCESTIVKIGEMGLFVDIKGT